MTLRSQLAALSGQLKIELWAGANSVFSDEGKAQLKVWFLYDELEMSGLNLIRTFAEALDDDDDSL